MPIFIKQISGKNGVGFAIGIWAIRTNIACVLGESLTPIFVDLFNFSFT